MDPKIVLGLGNPGRRYRLTRHNIGFGVVERLAERGGVKFRADEWLRSRAWVADLDTDSGPVVLAKPRTYMNRSGRAAVALCRRYDVSPGGLLVVHDDADMALGRIRIRRQGSAGGHNGIRSLIETLLSTEFPRIKLGVRGEGREEAELADYVLEQFDEDERPVADELVSLAVDAVDAVLREGIAAAMNEFNSRAVARVSGSDD